MKNESVVVAIALTSGMHISMFHYVSKLDFTFHQHLPGKPIVDYFPLQFFHDCVHFRKKIAYFRNVSSYNSGNTVYLQA